MGELNGNIPKTPEGVYYKILGELNTVNVHLSNIKKDIKDLSLLQSSNQKQTDQKHQSLGKEVERIAEELKTKDISEASIKEYISTQIGQDKEQKEIRNLDWTFYGKVMGVVFTGMLLFNILSKLISKFMP